MLRKLFKYDFTDSCRWMWMVYAGLMLAACFSGISMRLQLSQNGNSATAVLLMILTSMLLFLMVAAVFILTFVQIVLRFYRNLMGGEGYLMHTLPVHTWQLVTGKLLCALVLIIFAYLACLLAGGIWVLCSGTAGELDELGNSLAEIYSYYFSGVNSAGVIIRSVLLGLLSALSLVLVCYASLALGQLSDNHRILLAFAFFVAFRMISGFLSSSITLVRTMAGNSNDLLFTFMTGSGSVSKMIVQLLMGIVCFIVTEELLRKRLNLE